MTLVPPWPFARNERAPVLDLEKVREGVLNGSLARRTRFLADGDSPTIETVTPFIWAKPQASICSTSAVSVHSPSPRFTEKLPERSETNSTGDPVVTGWAMSLHEAIAAPCFVFKDPENTAASDNSPDKNKITKRGKLAFFMSKFSECFKEGRFPGIFSGVDSVAAERVSEFRLERYRPWSNRKLSRKPWSPPPRELLLVNQPGTPLSWRKK